jgi:hypothetical protein
MDGNVFHLEYSGKYGDFYFDNDHPHNMRDVELVWVESTGLHDKNRKEIWKGDRVRWHDPHIDCDDIIENITFQNGAFCHGGLPLHQISMMSLEVIGNIFEGGEELI